MLRSLHLASALFLSACSFATHIIGGEIFYDHVSGDDYLVTLKLYRDCAPGQTGFDDLAAIGVFRGNGSVFTTASVPLASSQVIPTVLEDPCLTVPPSICLEVGIYTHVFTLPGDPLGYSISYQRCCRAPSIVNIVSPAARGITCTVTVPPAVDAVNGSPRFNHLPSNALCMDKPASYDLSATDPDGDSLVYALTTPFHGADDIDPNPFMPAAPPYVLIEWAPPYTEGDPMDSDPPIHVDPQTGELTVHPSQIASYTVAVGVKEYRHGVMLSEVRRDFRFDVVVCSEPVAEFAATPASPQLAGTPVALLDATEPNGSTIVGWSWTLDGAPMPWTGPAPVWEDPHPGTHIIQLTVSTTTGCTDTYEMEYVITAGPVTFPNIFSPNGDGSNDRFVIPNAQYQQNQLHIYNRWGMVVYEAQNYQNQWNASGLPDGTYYYRIQLPGEQREHIGPVTLVR